MIRKTPAVVNISKPIPIKIELGESFFERRKFSVFEVEIWLRWKSEERFTEREYAEAWGWPKTKVHQYLLSRTNKPKAQATTEPAEPKEPTQLLHPSPKAPKHLNRYREELLSWPLPDQPGDVWMTEAKWKQFQTHCGSYDCACHLVERFEKYVKENPSYYKKRKDHYLTLCDWFDKAVSQGKVFFEHPQHGQGFYTQQVVDYQRGQRHA